MAKFLTGTSLIFELEKLISNASRELILISPYINLHQRYKDALKSKLTDHKLFITVVFGKNEGDLSKSFTASDYEFLRQFPNIEIRHEPNLHAKYYSNYDTSILTSMNLYTYSQDNNIESGILTENSLLTNIASSVSEISNIDADQYKYFLTVIENSRLLFKNTPVLKGMIIKDLDGIDNTVNHLSNVFSFAPGYCIATGVKIVFNPAYPLSKEAYRLWNKDKDFPQLYCHYSGEKSNNETSFNRPILKKNWSKSKSYKHQDS